MEDVVLKLYRNGLSDIVEEIFSYLDWREIKNATEVSSTWRGILMESEVEVWKSLWERSIDQVPAWNLLYKRAVCQGLMCNLQTHPNWNYKAACLVVGDAYLKLLSNWQQETYKEKREEIGVSESQCCEISSTKVCTTVGVFDELRIQERWYLDDDNPKEFKITGRPVQILFLEISEPYLVAVTSDHSTCVWDLERNQKVNDFIQDKIMDHLTLVMLHVKFNRGLLVTCARYGLNQSNNPPPSGTMNFLTARRLAMNEQQEPDFPIVDQIKIPNFIVESMFLEAKRLVMFNADYSQVLRVTTPPFQIICIEPVCPLIDRQRFWKGMQWATMLKLLDKYWNGWLVQNESSDTIRIMNVDTAVAFKHPCDYRGRQLDFEIANKHIIVSYQEDWNWKFDLWNLPRSISYSEEISLVYSFQQPHPHVYHENYYIRRNKWKVHFDDVQIWVFQYYDNWSLPDTHRQLVIMRDFAC